MKPLLKSSSNKRQNVQPIVTLIYASRKSSLVFESFVFQHWSVDFEQSCNCNYNTFNRFHTIVSPLLSETVDGQPVNLVLSIVSPSNQSHNMPINDAFFKVRFGDWVENARLVMQELFRHRERHRCWTVQIQFFLDDCVDLFRREWFCRRFVEMANHRRHHHTFFARLVDRHLTWIQCVSNGAKVFVFCIAIFVVGWLTFSQTLTFLFTNWVFVWQTRCSAFFADRVGPTPVFWATDHTFSGPVCQGFQRISTIAVSTHLATTQHIFNAQNTSKRSITVNAWPIGCNSDRWHCL